MALSKLPMMSPVVVASVLSLTVVRRARATELWTMREVQVVLQQGKSLVEHRWKGWPVDLDLHLGRTAAHGKVRLKWIWVENELRKHTVDLIVCNLCKVDSLARRISFCMSAMCILRL